jgi:hypothetical protein
MVRIWALLPVLILAGPAAAHHAFTDFDREKTVTLAGTVKSFDWTNPHVWIAVVTDGPRDAVWDIEGSSPNLLARGGWKPSTLKPGDKISMKIHPRRDGKSGGYLADETPVTVNGHKRGGVTAPWR